MLKKIVTSVTTGRMNDMLYLVALLALVLLCFMKISSAVTDLMRSY